MFFFLLVLFQFFQTESHISWQGSYYQQNDSTLQISITASIDDGYYIYGLQHYEFGPTPTSFDGNFDALRILELPPFKKVFDQGFELEIEKLKNSGTFTFIANTKQKQPFQINATYQICTDENCLPPKTDPIVLSKSETALFSETKELNLNNLKEKSITQFIFFAISMGLLALLTPCVFPMIPITVSFFTKNSKRSTKEAIAESFLYGIGIIATFTIFGVVVSQVFGATGVQNFAANPWVNISIALLFIVFALSLFGLFEIQLPTGFVNKVNKMGMKPGKLGTILAGVAFSLVSFTCTVQFVGLLLVATSQGEWLYPVLGMFFFSSAFASPFILLALFPQLMARLPKSGGWLHATKITLAFVEIAAAVKFLSQADLVWNFEIITRSGMLSMWIVLFAAAGFYLLGMVRLSKDDFVEHIGLTRLFTALLFLGFSVYMIGGLSGNALQTDLDSYLPPKEYGENRGHKNSVNGSKMELSWIENYHEALKRSADDQTFLFVDFTGKTCTNCRWMEKNMFVKPEIYSELQKFTRAKLWTDFGDQKEFNQQLEMKLFGTVALPFYAIIDSQGNVIRTFNRMTRNTDEFLRFLRL